MWWRGRAQAENREKAVSNQKLPGRPPSASEIASEIRSRLRHRVEVLALRRLPADDDPAGVFKTLQRPPYGLVGTLHRRRQRFDGDARLTGQRVHLRQRGDRLEDQIIDIVGRPLLFG